MTKASKSQTIKLDTYTDGNDHLDASFLAPTKERVSPHSDRGLQDILPRAGRKGSLLSRIKAAVMKLVSGAVPRRTEAAVLVAPASRAHAVSARLTNPDDLPPPGGDPIDVDPKGPGASS